MCRPTPAVLAIVGVERAQVHLVHRVEHEPRQMILRQPLRDRHRQQIQLITIPDDEVPAHDPIFVTQPAQQVDLTHPDQHPQTGFMQQALSSSDFTRSSRIDWQLVLATGQ